MTPRKTTRLEKLKQAFKAHYGAEDWKVESHIRGSDLSRSVVRKVLRPRDELFRSGDQFQVWVRDGGQAGIYGAPLGEDPRRLGTMIEGRHREIFEVREPFRVVLCTAATFPAGLAEGVGGLGGGLQYILPPGWTSKAEKIV
jgi:hypothetical protein